VTATYRLRYRLEPGAGVCLWATNDAAVERFGDAVDAHDLPLPENTWRRADYLVAWYDTSVDWSYPPDPSPWDENESARFDAEAQRFLGVLREQLGPEFEVEDGSGTLRGAG
jgi:hypothetical protein